MGRKLNKQIEMEERMTIPMHEIGWIAGFLEGEGHFNLGGSKSKTPYVEATQVDVGPIDRLHNRFGGKIWQEQRGGTYGRSKGNRQPCWRWQCVGSKSIQIMMTIYPLVSTKRRLEIERVIIIWKGAQIPPPRIQFCPGCNVPVNEDNITWISREDGKGRRKWCKYCGTRIA